MPEHGIFERKILVLNFEAILHIFHIFFELLLFSVLFLVWKPEIIPELAGPLVGFSDDFSIGRTHQNTKFPTGSVVSLGVIRGPNGKTHGFDFFKFLSIICLKPLPRERTTWYAV